MPLVKLYHKTNIRFQKLTYDIEKKVDDIESTHNDSKNEPNQKCPFYSGLLSMAKTEPGKNRAETATATPYCID